MPTNKHFSMKWDQKTGRYLIPSGPGNETGEKGKGLNAGRLSGPEGGLVYKKNKNFTAEQIDKMIDRVANGENLMEVINETASIALPADHDDEKHMDDLERMRDGANYKKKDKKPIKK